MNLGLFYQSGYRIEACYHALKQFRKFYPNAPVALYEDNTDILLPVAKKFNCIYKRTDKQGFNDPNSGRPAFDIETTTAWLDRVYEACTTTLKDVEWVVNMEDDVWFLGVVEETPQYDLTGIGGRGWQGDKLYETLGAKRRGSYGCGGSIFNREKFIEAYRGVQNVDWNLIEELAEDGSPTQWTDSMLTFVFLHSKFTAGPQNTINQQYRSDTVNIDEQKPENIPTIEQEHHYTKIVHCWKPYYRPSDEVKKQVEADLLPFSKNNSKLTSNFVTCALIGRTGNMMFEIANAYTQALSYDRQLVVPRSESSSRPLEKSLFRKIDFLIESTNDIPEPKVTRPGVFKFHSVIPPEENCPTVYRGFYQSDKFFGKYKNQIKSLFSPPPEFYEKAFKEYPFLKDEIVVGVSVRRGDYLDQCDRHPVITLEYIKEAYTKLPAHNRVLVMSDDIDWCKNHIDLPNVIFSDNTKFWNEEGLWLLSLCDHFVISNSTFSWWGAWLSNAHNKVVVAPGTWFGPNHELTDDDAQDIYCDGWIKIPTKYKDGRIVLQDEV